MIHPGRHEGVEKFIEEHGVTAPCKVLEIGSGFGGTTRHLHYKYGLEIDCVEVLSHFVECSTEINNILGISDKIRVFNGDIVTHELPENTYDVIVATVAFMYVADKAGLLNAMKALKPGGLFYLEEYYFIKPREQWDESDMHNIQARGMRGVRTKEEYYGIFEEMKMDIVEESEFGYHWSVEAWKRGQNIIDEGIEKDTGMESHYHQYVFVSPQLTCDLNHLTVEQIHEQFPGVAKQFDVEDLVFHKQRLTSMWRVIGRKRA